MVKDTPTYTPVEGYLLCKPLDEKETSGGIIIPEGDFEQLARVLKIGKDTYYPQTDIPLKAPCKVGQKIIHSSMGFENFRYLGRKYRIVPFTKVLAVEND